VAAEPLLQTVALRKEFGGLVAVDDIDFVIPAGSIVSLIGPNGAGKTTLVNVITGFDFPTSGRVELAGRDVTSWPPHRRGRAGLVRTFQHGHLFRGLSVRENVEVSALGSGARPREARRRVDRQEERRRDRRR